MKIGLKVYCTNDAYVVPAQKLYADGVIDFIEVFLVPGQMKQKIGQWIQLGVPLSLHAPHSVAGLNPSLASDFAKNQQVIGEVVAVRNLCEPLYVVFHPGVDGDFDESIRQFSWMMNSFPEMQNISLVENKPAKGLYGMNCLGTTPAEIRKMQGVTGIGFLLDFGHASCAAATYGDDYQQTISRFLELGPRAFHLSDGHIRSEDDEHLHIGHGDYNLAWFAKQIGDTGMVALESMKDSPDNLDDFVGDVNSFKKILRG